MKFTSFFIKHPVLAIILNAIIVVLGALSYKNISIREYPEIKLPCLVVNTTYSNASAELVETAVTNILEDKLAGVEGLEVITSQSVQGSSSIDLLFTEGSSVEQALIAVREAIGVARSDLPKDIQEPVIQQKKKADGTPFMAISISSPNLSNGELTHYANLNLKNSFRSLRGVASVEIWGQPYTMAVALDLQRLFSFGINADDVYKALEQNNISWPVGKFRDEIPTTMDLSLTSIEDFENLIIKENYGKPIYLKSIADIQLKTNTKSMRTRVNGKPGLIIAITRSTDANPLDVSRLVLDRVEHLKQNLPHDMSLKVVLDQADFIRASLINIQHSIIEAILLVLVIIFLFLRNLRATLVPLLTIPVSLIGSLLLLKICGFTLNTITLLAMVLAIGLVVDDAIVVLENIERHLAKGKSTLQAAISGSHEIGFAIIAMTLTLASVYAPIAFIQGSVGKLFVEFAVTLAGSVLISGIVALTLSPLMCAKILRSEEKRLFPKIDHYIHQLEYYYQQALEQSLRRPKFVLCIAGVTFISLIYLFSHLPSEIAPKEDRGLIGVYLPQIPGKDIKTLSTYVKRVENNVRDLADSTGIIAFMGDWGANVLVSLKPQKQRHQSAEELVRVLKPQMDQLPSIDAQTWSWDSGLPGLDDIIAGSEITMVISTTSGYRKLFEQMESIRKAIDDTQEFDYVRHDLSLDTPGYSIVLDPNAVFKLGLTTFQVAKTVEVFFSGQQSLFFQKEGIRYPITIEGTSVPWSLDELYLTNPQGKRISLGTLGELRTSTVPKELNHYNQLHSATLSVGLKSNQHMKLALPRIWDISSNILSEDFKRDWTGSAKMYNKSSMSMLLLFGLAVIFIYAILAVQFENFLDPFIILFTVPLGCFGALLTAWLFNQSLNIYTEIGLVTLIGLITKHGILIVEFANQLKEGGKTVEAAIREAARLRLRPILMTTAAMIFGALPLILSSGAGVEARRAIGLILLGGLLFGTFFTLLILPKIYELIKVKIEPSTSST